jgi:hypothetical protein
LLSFRGFGESPLDRGDGSTLLAEPFLQTFHVQLQMPTDQLAVGGGRDDTDLVPRHPLIPKDHLRPGDGV